MGYLMTGQPATGQPAVQQPVAAWPYTQAPYGGGYYPYPASYSSYPSKLAHYGGHAGTSKLLYPIILVMAGLLLVAFSFMSIEKLDPQISRIATVSPDMEIVAVVFCDPCTAINGDPIGLDKVMVVDDALSVRQISNLPGVKQVKLVGRV